jgi:DNA-methyltransferase (dcm)
MVGIDLFSGAGGMSQGAIQAGVQVSIAVECDRHAAESYRQNHPQTCLFENDIKNLSNRAIAQWKYEQKPIVVFGGPPCQGFSWSNARTRNVDNESNWLFNEYLRVIKILKPEWLIFENVRGIIDTTGGYFLAQISRKIKNMGYTISMELLNAMEFGVPQDRTRFFLVGNRDGRVFRFPKSPSKKHVTVYEAISDLPVIENGNTASWLEYGQISPSAYAKKMRKKLKGCFNHLVTCNSPLVIKRYKFIPQGGNWEDVPLRLMKNYKDRTRCHTGIYYRLREDVPAVVIGNYRKNMLIHPEQDRGLSVREAARIQSFPDSYVFCGSLGFQQQQVGNAVPPLLAKAVFQSLLEQTE